MRLRPLAALLFCSGAAALILEVAWFRRMAQITGATSIALAAVLAAVIGGMALGAWWIGRRADRTARPLRLYAVLETGVALFALASPVLLDSSQTLFTALRRALPDSPAALLTARFLLAVALLTPPAILLGGTLPAMAAALRSRREDLGRGLGLLYAWNTLGAVAGTLLAGFVLLPSLGLFGTMHMAFFFSAIAAAGGFFWGGKRAAAKDAAIVQHSFCAAQRRNALRLYAASGFLGMAAQVAFARSLVLVFGSTTYAFTTMLAIFLFGIATGGALGTRWTSPPEKVLRRLATTVALTAALFSVSALAVYFLPRLYLLGYLEIGNSFEAGIALRFLLAGCVLLPGTIGLGVAFPLAARVAGEGAAGAGTGRLYAANTAASVLGSTLAVFALVPWIGPQGTVALVAVCVATVVTALARRRGLVALILLSATGFVPPSATARERLLSGVYYTPNRYLDGDRIDDSAWQDGSDIPYFEYGRDATVSILRWYGQPGVLVDGKAVATAQNITDVHHLELLGHIPMLLHPDPQRVLVVGLGMGTTYRAVELYKPDSLTVVEIEAAVSGAAARLGIEPERVVIEDARSFLRATDERFDVITSDPIHPWVRGGGDLYTQEYFESVKSRLAEDGVACQWLPLYQMGLVDVRAVARTFAGVFHTSMYFSGADLILVGTDGPRTLIPREPPGNVRDVLAAIGAEQIGQLRVADHERTLRAAVGETVLTDDSLQLEFSTPRHVESPELVECLTWVLDTWKKPAPPFGALLKAVRAAADADADALSKWLEQASKEEPDNGFVRRYAGETYLRHASALARKGEHEAAESFLNHARTRLPGDPRLIGTEADLLEARGDDAGAAALLRQLLEQYPDSAYLRRRVARLR